MKAIKISSGDTGFKPTFQLVNRETGRPLDMTEDGTAASFHFIGRTGEVFHLTCQTVAAAFGLVAVEWPPVGLLEPGLYEGVFRVVFPDQKAITVQERVPFEVAEALPCVAGTGNAINSPQSWFVQNGVLMVANVDHPNVYHPVAITGDPDNPTIDVGPGQIVDGGAT